MTLWPHSTDLSPIASRPQHLGLLLAAFLLSDPALAQPTKPARVGWATVSPLAQVESLMEAFRSGLAAHGYVEGQNLEFIPRSANGASERAPAVIEELVRLKPDVIVVHAAATFSARQVTTVPVVFGFSGDPLVAGFTDSLARPSGNMTGVTFMSVEMNEKRLDLLRQMAPQVKKVVLMGSPIHPGADLEVAASKAMAERLGVDVLWRPTRDAQDVLNLLAEMEAGAPDALIVLPDAIMLETRKQVAEFAARHRIPAGSGWSTFAHSGGLFAYGPRLTERFHRLADYAARVIRGAKPSDLPVERPSFFELVINLRTAKEIGLDVPPSLLARADEVIE